MNMIAMICFFFVLGAAVFVFPLEDLPHTNATTGRALLGAFLFIMAGVAITKVFS